MGSAGRNFYNETFSRLGFAGEVQHVEDLWRAGRRDDAADAVPLDLGRLTNLLGAGEAISSRLDLYSEAGITTILAKLDGPPDTRLATLERLIDLAS